MEVNRHFTNDIYPRSRSRRRVKLSSNEILQGKKYLKNPTSAGLWKLEAKWQFDSPISNSIREEVTLNRDKLKKVRNRISTDPRDADSLLITLESLSFYLRLFSRMIQAEDEEAALSDYAYEREQDDIINLLDLNALSVKYKRALTYFRKEIYKADSAMFVPKQGLAAIKSGSFACPQGPGDLEGSAKSSGLREEVYRSMEGKTNIELISLSVDPINNIARFFEELQLVDDIKIYKLFSPEEEALSLYVDILSAIMRYLMPRESDSQFFAKMISDYENNNYTGCISTAGLVAEDCLTQIYETIHRTPVPRRMTLGSLKQKIGEATKNRDTKELKHDKVTRLMTEYREKNKTDPVRLADINSKLLLKYFDEKYKKLDLRVDSIEGELKNDEFFPAIIRMNLEDIIRFRNAVSHKSLDPIGSFDALKSIYCSLSLSVWWDEEKKKIDWTKDQKEIIKQFVISAKNF